ncbi:MAG: glycoside hydrolase family 3 C-terminal domain-containing protein [Prevotellaceae bacterium]|jgi:beta-glucosidase|nr:glycoside hydrolase family 3 C-terminal domain-containing protein [Prevotellaceae bacterium]
MKKVLCYTLFLTVFTVLGCSQQSKNSNDVEKKINSLLSQMTLDEKIGQMNQLTDVGINDDVKAQIKNGSVGSFLNTMSPEQINEMQKIAVEESRLGIPLVFARDIIHGFKTIFPVPLGQAASFNPEVGYNGARVAAVEASSVGIRWTFTPMMDISRDARWGRIAESCGEDPVLTAKMVVAMIRGFQGENLADPTSIAACAKHFAGYGAAESGKDYNTTWIPEELLRDVYLVPFEAAAKAGCATFMCSFNDINGVPSSGNRHLNVDILRNEWGYDGVLVSDWGSAQQMIPHGFSEDLKQAAEQAANAGMDMDMMGFAYINHLKELVNEGVVSEKTIDSAVRNILRLKYRLGLFDKPYVEIKDSTVFYAKESLEKAKQAAVESAVLLKNENNVLPLANLKSVAVIGALADAPADQVGTWCFDAEPSHSVTPIAAITEAYGKDVKINYVQTLKYSRDKNKSDFPKALAAARNSDAVLYFVGEEAILSGEAKCLADISLQGAQSELLTELKKSGKPVVLVVMAGRPLTIEKEAKEADAILYAFHGGTMAGAALADLIFGKAVPSGKLPVTMPKMVGQIPIYYNHKNTGRPTGKGATLIDEIPVGAGQFSIGSTSYHLDAGSEPLYPFGYGLSYTTFEYSDVQLSDTVISLNGKITAKCTIKNTGKYDACEVVQFYMRDLVGELIRPVKELKDFQKILIKAGESREVEFTLTTDDLAYWHSDMKKRADKGKFYLWIAPSSDLGKAVEFKLK